MFKASEKIFGKSFICETSLKILHVLSPVLTVIYLRLLEDTVLRVGNEDLILCKINFQSEWKKIF